MPETLSLLFCAGDHFFTQFTKVISLQQLSMHFSSIQVIVTQRHGDFMFYLSFNFWCNSPNKCNSHHKLLLWGTLFSMSMTNVRFHIELKRVLSNMSLPFPGNVLHVCSLQKTPPVKCTIEGGKKRLILTPWNFGLCLVVWMKMYKADVWLKNLMGCILPFGLNKNWIHQQPDNQ